MLVAAKSAFNRQKALRNFSVEIRPVPLSFARRCGCKATQSVSSERSSTGGRKRYSRNQSDTPSVPQGWSDALEGSWAKSGAVESRSRKSRMRDMGRCLIKVDLFYCGIKFHTTIPGQNVVVSHGVKRSVKFQIQCFLLK